MTSGDSVEFPNDEIRRDYVIRCERNLRMPIYWVLDEKAKVASCIEMRESVKATIREVGIDYWRRVKKEFIEEGRRGQLARTIRGRVVELARALAPDFVVLARPLARLIHALARRVGDV